MKSKHTESRSEASRLADQLRRAFDGSAWHGPALLELLEDVDAATAAAKPLLKVHSIWELVLHIAVWDGAALPHQLRSAEGRRLRHIHDGPRFFFRIVRMGCLGRSTPRTIGTPNLARRWESYPASRVAFRRRGKHQPSLDEPNGFLCGPGAGAGRCGSGECTLFQLRPYRNCSSAGRMPRCPLRGWLRDDRSDQPTRECQHP